MTFPSRSLILANTSLSEAVERLTEDAERKKKDQLHIRDDPLVIILLVKLKGGKTDKYAKGNIFI